MQWLLAINLIMTKPCALVSLRYSLLPLRYEASQNMASLVHNSLVPLGSIPRLFAWCPSPLL